MTTQEMIKQLKEKSPAALNPTFTPDMGMEITLITDQGVIFQRPGMLLSFSDGDLPFDDETTAEDYSQTIHNLVEHFADWMIPYKKLDESDIEWLLECLEDAEK